LLPAKKTAEGRDFIEEVPVLSNLASRRGKPAKKSAALEAALKSTKGGGWRRLGA